MTTRRVLWVVAGLVVFALVALMLPVSPVYFPKLMSGSQGVFEGHATRYWIKSLASPDEEVRRDAIHALGAIGPDAPEAVTAMSKIMLESRSPQERSEASLALLKMVPASRTEVPALARALEDEEPLVRMNAVQTLVRLGPESRPAMKALIKALKDKDNLTNLDTFPYSIRGEAALALGRASAGTAEAVPTLMEALQTIRQDKTNPEIKTVNRGAGASRMPSAETSKQKSSLTVIRDKSAFARALGEVGPEAKPAVPLLRAMIAEDQISDFRDEAKAALQKIEGKLAAAPAVSGSE